MSVALWRWRWHQANITSAIEAARALMRPDVMLPQARAVWRKGMTEYQLMRHLKCGWNRARRLLLDLKKEKDDGDS